MGQHPFRNSLDTKVPHSEIGFRVWGAGGRGWGLCGTIGQHPFRNSLEGPCFWLPLLQLSAYQIFLLKLSTLNLEATSEEKNRETKTFQKIRYYSEPRALVKSLWLVFRSTDLLVQSGA